MPKRVPVMIPELGNGIRTVKLVEWLVKKGDTVKKGDFIVVVETEKLAFEVEAPETGVIKKLRYSGGDKVNLAKPLGYIAKPDEEMDSDAAELSRTGRKATEQGATLQDKPSRRGLRQILRRMMSKD